MPLNLIIILTIEAAYGCNLLYSSVCLTIKQLHLFYLFIYTVRCWNCWGILLSTKWTEDYKGEVVLSKMYNIVKITILLYKSNIDFYCPYKKKYLTNFKVWI